MRECYYCDQPATHTDSVPAPDEAAGPHEFTYKTIYLCRLHAEEHKCVATSRVKRITQAECEHYFVPERALGQDNDEIITSVCVHCGFEERCS